MKFLSGILISLLAFVITTNAELRERPSAAAAPIPIEELPSVDIEKKSKSIFIPAAGLGNRGRRNVAPQNAVGSPAAAGSAGNPVRVPSKQINPAPVPFPLAQQVIVQPNLAPNENPTGTKLNANKANEGNRKTAGHGRNRQQKQRQRTEAHKNGENRGVPAGQQPKGRKQGIGKTSGDGEPIA